MSELDTLAFWIVEDQVPRQVGWAEYLAWVKSDPDSDKRRVAQETVGEAWVSTVFLTVDHGFGRARPILFETMIFGGPHDLATWRYGSWAEAETGHARVVAVLRDGRDPE